MSINATRNLAEFRTIITNTCLMLQDARERAVGYGRESYVSDADWYVLLNDTTKLFCRALSEIYGEADRLRRWSPAVPELLIAYPEKCHETLTVLERKDFQQLSYFQFVDA